MLPAPVLFKMDELNVNGVNSVNGSFQYDDSVILNCVRNRKKVSELPNCPVCSCTIRHGELESHLALEVERLQKLSSGASKRKLSSTSHSPSTPNLAVPGTSTDPDEDFDLSGFTGSDIYERVHENRIRRLRARRRSPPLAQTGECPVCNTKVPVSKIQRHALRCLKRTGAAMDEDVPDTSSDDESIDVENDEPSTGFGAEYSWCGEWRVRARALLPPTRSQTTRRPSTDQALVVDGDEDTELYGPPQYSPSRIAPDAEIPSLETDQQSNGSQDSADNQEIPNEAPKKDLSSNGLIEASAETRIQALKAKIKELETKQNSSAEAKCLICLGAYTSPAVSIQCWHVYCEVCWLQSLRAKKICPQCNTITTAEHLRRIYI
ncbi:E3 ubiquitin-protein ligase Rnf220 [Epargyreus clarus]|uniref:E3 ubiquitin-protein ligase Rnf220 n=1 Tax=Epargyreus clarus TaxID=520877 RepID=UPI003C2CED4E